MTRRGVAGMMRRRLLRTGAGRALRVGTVPDTHPYLTAVLPGNVQHERFSPPTATGWEPSPLLDAVARRRALPGLDVVHVHFGYEGCSRRDLEAVVTDVRAAGVALVVTVHDLRNPHERDSTRHDRHLSTLLAAADVVITLTAGAADEIARRWSRTATVLAHPTLLPVDAPSVAARRPDANGCRARVVGVHLKSLRANVVDPVPLVLAAAAGAHDGGGLLRVDVHDPGADPVVVRELAAAAADGTFELRGHDRFTDDELLDYLSGLDVSLLPYRFGTHSGWLELCRDLGVAVIAPDCGYYAEQWSRVVSYVHNERVGLDPGSLHDAVAAALTAGPPGPADRRERLDGLADVRAAHARMYAAALGSLRDTGAA